MKLVVNRDALSMAADAMDEVQAEKLRKHALAYTHTDLLYFRDTGKSRMHERQQEVWDPLLDWAANYLKVSFETTTTLVPPDQSDEVCAALKDYVYGLDAHRLTCLNTLIGPVGSLLVSMAVLEGHVTPEQAVEAAFLEQLVQEEQWGADEEAEAKRAEILESINTVYTSLNDHDI